MVRHGCSDYGRPGTAARWTRRIRIEKIREVKNDGAVVLPRGKARVRAISLVLGDVAIVALGLVLGPHPASTIVSVRFVGHHFVVARGGIPATIAPIALLLVGILIPAWAIINAMRTPTSTFSSLGRSKGRWVASMIILFFIGDASFLLVPS